MSFRHNRSSIFNRFLRGMTFMLQELGSRYAEILATVREHLRGAAERPWSVIEPEADAYLRLLETVTARLNWEGDLLPLSAAVSMALVHVPTFSEEAHREVIRIVEDSLPKEQRVRRCIEVVIAYESNAWPCPRVGVEPNPVAVAWLAAIVRLSIIKSFRWLRGRVTNLWEIIGTDKEHFFDLTADHVTWQLLHGACDCIKLTERHDYRVNKKNVEEMSRRHLRDHFLSAWHPERQYLWDFLANAVRGRGGLKPGSIRQGMVYSTFQEELGARVANLPRKYCIHLGKFYALHDTICPYCKFPHPASETPVEVALEIILTRVYPGPDGRLPYRVIETKWWRCQTCAKVAELTGGEVTQHFFPDDADPAKKGICPLCGKNLRGRGKSCGEAFVRVPVSEDSAIPVEIPKTPPVPGLADELQELAQGVTFGSDASVSSVVGDRALLWAVVKPVDGSQFHLSLHFSPRQPEMYREGRVNTGGILASKAAMEGSEPFRGIGAIAALSFIDGPEVTSLLESIADDKRRTADVRALARQVLDQRKAEPLPESAFAGWRFELRSADGKKVFPAATRHWGQLVFRGLPRAEGPYRLELLGETG